MDYNTERKKIALPEYGRSIHKMVDWVCTIEDRDERNKQIQAVIAVMGGMNPHLRDVNDFKHKLWDHVQIMSNFQIDIDSPYPIPNPETFRSEKNIIPYQTEPIRIRHYGRNIQTMIENLADRENSEAKEKALLLLANHMKKSYVTWNKDVVYDDIIFRDIEILSQGRLKLPEGTKLAPAYNLNMQANTSSSPKTIQKAKQPVHHHSSNINNNKKKKKR